MINHENSVFTTVATKLRATYGDMYISGAESLDLPSKFPSVMLKLEDNPVLLSASSFSKMENATEETYYVEIMSNLTKNKEKQCKDIMGTIDTEMAKLGFYRTYNQQIQAVNSTLCRRIGRFKKIQTEV